MLGAFLIFWFLDDVSSVQIKRDENYFNPTWLLFGEKPQRNPVWWRHVKLELDTWFAHGGIFKFFPRKLSFLFTFGKYEEYLLRSAYIFISYKRPKKVQDDSLGTIL